jgi:adhesin transport system membrane fusion protein
MKLMGRAAPRIEAGDIGYLSPVRGAQVVEPAPAAMWSVYLMIAALGAALGWAALAEVDIVAKASARVVPDGREQLIASLEGGILRQLHVREGQQVDKGQALALIDPTRFEAQQAEGEKRRLALAGAQARLQAEAFGRGLKFPPDLPEGVKAAESENFEARRRSLDEAVETHRRSIGLLRKELEVADRMSGKGLMSEVEVMRVRRQVNDLELQVQERINRLRQEASSELVRVRNEIALLDEQMVIRNDALERTTLTSPVRGIVKQIRANTLGGVVGPGAPLMEIVPLGERVLIEARIKPADIGFVRVGQPVEVKLATYDYTIFGGVKGRVLSISPDALGDPDRAALPEGTWYRALVRAEPGALPRGSDGKALDVVPGMTGTAEIRTGERSVLRFLLRPLVKSQEAFRER